MQAGQATVHRIVAGQLFRKLLKKFPANYDESLTWAWAEWAVSGGSDLGTVLRMWRINSEPPKYLLRC